MGNIFRNKIRTCETPLEHDRNTLRTRKKTKKSSLPPPLKKRTGPLMSAC